MLYVRDGQETQKYRYLTSTSVCDHVQSCCPQYRLPLPITTVHSEPTSTVRRQLTVFNQYASTIVGVLR